MKRFALLFGISFLTITAVFSQNSTLKHANELYVKGNYVDAARIYESVISKLGVSPELYYNLGNTYYKINETGRSILNYERALRLNPSFDDAKYNLEIAQLKVVDNIAQNQPFFLNRWLTNFIKFLNSNQWFYLSMIFFISALALTFVFLFGRTRFVRKSSFYFALVLFIFTVSTIIFSGVRHHQFTQHNEAIIITGAVTVKSSPDKSGTDLFQLHEGTKVGVKSALGEWVEIKLANGSVGWLKAESIERI